MTDPMTDADLDAIEERYPSTEAWEAGLIAMGTRARTDVPALLVEVRRLQDAVERVRALHVPVEVEPSDTICRECSLRLPNGRYFGKLVEHPCPTITALDGDKQ